MGTGNDLWDQFAALLTKADYDGLVALFSPDAVYIAPDGRREGREGIRAWIDEWLPALSDVHIDTTRVVQQDSTIVGEYSWQSTHTGPITLPDGTVFPATGKTARFPAVTILDVRDGQIVAARDYYDQLDLFSQMGLMPGG
jgi:steroid delta-isomerase-like uncharacterized protein